MLLLACLGERSVRSVYARPPNGQTTAPPAHQPPREGEGECVYEIEGGTCEGLLHGIGATRVSFMLRVMPLEERADWVDRTGWTGWWRRGSACGSSW